MTWRLDEGFVALGDVPEGADRKELLRALGRGLAATKRFGKVLVGGKRPPSAATIRVEVETDDLPYGRAYGFTFSILGADGEVIDEHPSYCSAVVPPAELAGHAEESALVVADEARYPGLVRKRGRVGDVQHPRRARLEPRGVISLAACALQNGQTVGLRNVARQALDAIAACADPAWRVRLRRFAADLLSGVGDARGAREALGEGLLEDAPSEDDAGPMRLRLKGLAAQQELGPDFVPALVALGRGIVSLSDDRGQGLFRAAAALRAAGCPSLLRSEEELQALVRGDLMGVVGARFGPVASMVVGAAAALVDAAATDRRAGPEALQPARPLLQTVLGEAAVEDAMAALAQGGDAARALAALAPVEQRFAARHALWDAHRALGEGHVEQAVAAFERLAAAAPDPAALSGLARALGVAGRLDDAAERLRQAVALDPQRSGDHAFLASIEVDAGRPFQEPLLAAVRQDAYDDTAPLVYACAARSRGDLQEALAHLARALALNGPSPDLAYSIGTTLLDSGRHEEALPHLGVADLPGAQPEWKVNRGICLFRLGRHQEAIRDLSAGHRARPTLMNAVAFRGLARAATGDRAGARVDLEAYLKAHPHGSLADQARAALGR